MGEMVARDKNRASVVMWSVANEPKSEVPEARPYFDKVVQHTRKLDPTRPITVVVNANVDKDEASKSVDIVGLNRCLLLVLRQTLLMLSIS
jgi:beta-glucuronidase